MAALASAAAPGRLLISAAHKSSGKTTVSIGLCAALTARGVVVQPFKKGPDYIDPMWLSRAAGRACRNLDPYLSAAAELRSCFATHAAGAMLALVEGNKGLYDGLALDGSNSNAALARMLGLPVVLVIDARGMTRGIAPLILGYQAFDRDIRIAGVILNNLGGSRHEGKLRAVIEHYTDVAVVGALHCDPGLAIVERHLGLMPSNESDAVAERVAAISTRVAAQVDLDEILRIAATGRETASDWSTLDSVTLDLATVDSPPSTSAKNQENPDSPPTASAPALPELRIGIAEDRAFGFYYADDKDALRAAGATLVPIDTLADTALPDLDGLFIGGGFPEHFAAELAANAALRRQLRDAIATGLPVYAECGGLMYLARSLQCDGQTHAMVGAIPGDAVMHERPVGRGYVSLQETNTFPWPRRAAAVQEAATSSRPSGGEAVTGTVVRGHEFHYSSLDKLPGDARYAYVVKRGHGIDGERDGLVVGNVLASYAHLRDRAGSDWPARFLAFVRQVGYRRRGTADDADDAHNAVGSGIRTYCVDVDGTKVATDSEGYLLDREQWTEAFAEALARQEGLELTPAHWEVVHFLRDYYAEHGVQAQVRVMIQHFTARWGPEQGSNHHLHDMFPRGGPQKQGNRLAGLLRTKGEH